MAKDLSNIYGSNFNQLIYTAMVIASENVNSKDPEKKTLAKSNSDISTKMLNIRLKEQEIVAINKKLRDRSGLRVLSKDLEAILVDVVTEAKKTKSGRELIVNEVIKIRVKDLNGLADTYVKASETRLAKAKNLRKPQIRKKTVRKRRPGK